MKIGVPKEIEQNESRVGIAPAGVYELIKNNHSVFVEKSAGMGSGFFDEDYIIVGATIVDSVKDVFSNSDMIVKVKEPIS